ncbi:hypothetical protein [Methylomonas rivi]|uniref:DUF429 domain-containing protein n=1 Tax=Methylomonas rivi TaxID=2952226 RepID=A0ABT1U6C9_9GAMM|nr:hypothetical protein [Methylomonas sp. WSC-6]MCQ8129413.1 hypothetical protein [Methylomonas sp. WSC-6]
MLPKLVVHADWSTNTNKRWMCKAILHQNIYKILPPEPVDTKNIIYSSLREANDWGVIFGFDFPIGIPKYYADQASIHRFLDILPEFGLGIWSDFYKVAETPEEISIHRPFYPRKCINKGDVNQKHLVNGIGVNDIKALLRRCELGVGKRNDACSLFWTLGGNQVGKAAISGWREILVPAINLLNNELVIWPFDAQLDQMNEFKTAMIVETYPGDACVQIGIGAPGKGWSKRKAIDRLNKMHAIKQFAHKIDVDLKMVESELSQGFGNSAIGEDKFDALVGLLGMLSVIMGYSDDGLPNDDAIKSVEGWIFGQNI